MTMSPARISGCSPPPKPGTDHEVGTVTADGHFGGDAGALLADPEGQQRDGLTAERALVKIKVFLADDMVGVRPGAESGEVPDVPQRE